MTFDSDWESDVFGGSRRRFHRGDPASPSGDYPRPSASPPRVPQETHSLDLGRPVFQPCTISCDKIDLDPAGDIAILLRRVLGGEFGLTNIPFSKRYVRTEIVMETPDHRSQYRTERIEPVYSWEYARNAQICPACGGIGAAFCEKKGQVSRTTDIANEEVTLTIKWARTGQLLDLFDPASFHTLKIKFQKPAVAGEMNPPPQAVKERYVLVIEADEGELRSVIQNAKFSVAVDELKCRDPNTLRSAAVVRPSEDGKKRPKETTTVFNHSGDPVSRVMFPDQSGPAAPRPGSVGYDGELARAPTVSWQDIQRAARGSPSNRIGGPTETERRARNLAERLRRR